MFMQLISGHPVLAAVCVSVAYLVYTYVLQPFWLSPFKEVPGPWFCRISAIPSLHYQRTSQWNNVVDKIHRTYRSDVVLIGPNQLSFNSAKYLKDIYIRNLPKGQFYGQFGNHGHENVFSTLANEPHLARKKLLNQMYTKSSIIGSKYKSDLLHEKIRKTVNEVMITSVDANSPDFEMAKSYWNEFGKGAQENNSANWLKPKGSNMGMEMYFLFSALAMDVVSAFELGPQNGTDLLSNKSQRVIIQNHRQQSSMQFYTTLAPSFWSYAAGKEISKASQTVEAWQLDLYTKSEKSKSNPGFISTLEILNENGYHDKEAYSFLSDHLFAGHETSAIQMTYLCYQLSRPVNNHIQKRLQEELVETFGIPAFDSLNSEPHNLDLEVVEDLPYLEAILQENLRLHASIPGGQPRRVDSRNFTVEVNGTTIKVPENTIVSSQSWTLHRDDSVFPEPDKFIPERWLKYEDETDGEYKTRLFRQRKNMMAFGQGTRMCLGMGLALLEIKLVIANLYWRFESKICQDWCEIVESDRAKDIMMGESNLKTRSTDEEKMVMVDAYTSRPADDECWLEWYKVVV